MHLNIFVSQKCFLYCKGCYSFSRTEEYGKMVETDILVSFLKHAYEKGLRKVTLCGGDPLTRDDIIDLLQKLKKIGYNISLDTVGISIISDVTIGNNIIKQINVEKLAKLVDEIGIPIDVSTNEIIRLFRQTNLDIINDQISICDKLNNYNANICINTVVHKGNLKDAENMCKLINNLKYIKKWQLFKYAPMGKFGIINRDLFEISDDDFEKFKKEVLNISDRKAIIEFKDFNSRNKKYVLVDNSGNAWIPIYEQAVFDSYEKKVEKRKLIGNIYNSNDWNKICDILRNIEV